MKYGLIKHTRGTHTARQYYNETTQSSSHNSRSYKPKLCVLHRRLRFVRIGQGCAHAWLKFGACCVWTPAQSTTRCSTLVVAECGLCSSGAARHYASINANTTNGAGPGVCVSSAVAAYTWWPALKFESSRTAAAVPIRDNCVC